MVSVSILSAAAALVVLVVYKFRAGLRVCPLCLFDRVYILRLRSLFIPFRLVASQLRSWVKATLLPFESLWSHLADLFLEPRGPLDLALEENRRILAALCTRTTADSFAFIGYFNQTHEVISVVPFLMGSPSVYTRSLSVMKQLLHEDMGRKLDKPRPLTSAL